MLSHIKHPIRQPFAGGLEAFTYDIVKGLQARGHEVKLFASESSDPELGLAAICSDANYDTQSGCRGWLNDAEEFVSEHRAYLDLMRSVDGHSFDVLFNNSLHYLPVNMASLVETPMLTVLHTPPFAELINAYSAAGGAGRFATPSRANAHSWASLLTDCTVIPNGIDLSFWRPAELAADHAIWFGRVVPEKGTHLAIDAARRAGLKLRIAGPAVNQRYFDEFIAPRLGNGIEYLGHLSRAELVHEISGAAVALITPRWDEPFGLVVAESLACGTPVAGFARGALPELVDAETGSLAPADDVEALAVSILEAKDKSRAACRARAVANWGYERMLERYEALLAETAGIAELGAKPFQASVSTALSR
ncbi:glycosyltransferase [Pseudomonas sp. Marseille-QA0892]